MLSNLYKLYLSLLSGLGNLLLRQNNTTSSATGLPVPQDFASADARATILGNRYRGLGVAIALLGVLILLCALLPPALELTGWSKRIFGISKTLLMLLIVLMVLWANAVHLRQSWIAARRQAEGLRYTQLAQLIHEAEQQVQQLDKGRASWQEAAHILQEELRSLTELNLDKSQYSYHASKASIYEAIERCSDWLGYLGFSVAFIAACVDLLLGMPQLLLLTAFLPVLVGGIHGLNNFLKLSDLADQHHTMAQRLALLNAELEKLDPGDSQRLLDLAKTALNLLADQDTQWAMMANRLHIKVG